MNKIWVVGDVIEDIIVMPDAAIRPNTDTRAKIHRSMGGQAANVAFWLAHLHAPTQFTGCVGRADVESIGADFSRHRVDAELQSCSTPTGSTVILVQGAERSMLTDRGANLRLNLDAIDPVGCAAVYLSGYALLGRDMHEFQNFANRVKRAGALLAIDPGSVGFIKDHDLGHFRALVSCADLIFPNLEEEQLLELSGQVPLTIITKGHAGATAVWGHGQRLEVAGAPAAMVDPTGAGDAFCAGFLAHLVAAWPDGKTLSLQAVRPAMLAGVEAGARAVGQVGARPAGSTYHALHVHAHDPPTNII